MAWTDERVEQLKKLWSEGLSASQIAKQLGGVTRNAVIGKVHRLGLSGRATPSRPARRTVKPSRPRTTTASTAPTPRPAARPSPSASPAPQAPAPVEPAVLPSGEFATVLTLRDSMCKWPIRPRRNSASAAARPPVAMPIARLTPRWPISRAPSAAAARPMPVLPSMRSRPPAGTISRDYAQRTGPPSPRRPESSGRSHPGAAVFHAPVPVAD